MGRTMRNCYLPIADANRPRWKYFMKCPVINGNWLVQKNFGKRQFLVFKIRERRI